MLARHTGWSLAEIGGLEVGEFIDWLNAIPKNPTT